MRKDFKSPRKQYVQTVFQCSLHVNASSRFKISILRSYTLQRNLSNQITCGASFLLPFLKDTICVTHNNWEGWLWSIRALLILFPSTPQSTAVILGFDRTNVQVCDKPRPTGICHTVTLSCHQPFPLRSHTDQGWIFKQ